PDLAAHVALVAVLQADVMCRRSRLVSALLHRRRRGSRVKWRPDGRNAVGVDRERQLRPHQRHQGEERYAEPEAARADHDMVSLGPWTGKTLTRIKPACAPRYGWRGVSPVIHFRKAAGTTSLAWSGARFGGVRRGHRDHLEHLLAVARELGAADAADLG